MQCEVGLGAPSGPQVKTWDVILGVLETYGRGSLRVSTATGMQWSLGNGRSAGFCICWRLMWSAHWYEGVKEAQRRTLGVFPEHMGVQ